MTKDQVNDDNRTNSHPPCSRVIRNEQRIVTLESDMSETKAAVTEIRDKLLGRLPNWATALISLLGMVATGLIVARFAK